ncbi:MAG: hypothetical protein LC117_01525 [Bacteroidia bacterium]|nr:hypothetical protein [Bacteroidia bacterium]MCZ2276594.1 hypothetical protein [Bacteroidia bacterium]
MFMVKFNPGDDYLTSAGCLVVAKTGMLRQESDTKATFFWALILEADK